MRIASTNLLKRLQKQYDRGIRKHEVQGKSRRWIWELHLLGLVEKIGKYYRLTEAGVNWKRKESIDEGEDGGS